MLWCLLLSVGLLPTLAQDEDAIFDNGQYSFEIPNEWTVTETDEYVIVAAPDDEILNYLVVIETEDMEQAILDTWAIVDPTFDATDYTDADKQEITDVAQLNGFEKGLLIIYENGLAAGNRFLVAGASLFEGKSYVSITDTTLINLQQRIAQYQVFGLSFQAAGMQAAAGLNGADRQAWDAEKSAALDEFVAQVLTDLDVAGLSLAVVQDGEIVYAQGYGVGDEAGTPVNADTYMMIGSITKSLTTFMMAQAVDAGNMAWDTPVVEIYPSFAVADPALTQTLTMQNLVCACTGVPRRDLEFFFNSPTAEEIVASLADYEFFTDFGEAFQYSNQMVAAGGYLAAVALSGDSADLLSNYTSVMQAQVFDPLQMNRTTFDFDQIAADDNVALPYGVTLQGYQEMPLASEFWSIPIAPAGAVWSTAPDMAQFIITMLNEGSAPDGTTVVSAENLRHTWTPQIEIDPNTDYGLGWFVGEFAGLPSISHGGNMLGYSAELGFLPEQNIGVVVLVNQRASSAPKLVQSRVYELFFGATEDSRTLQAFPSVVENVTKSREETARQIEDGEVVATVDAAELAPWLGTYANAALGTTTFTVTDDTLSVDVGEFTADLWYVNLPSGITGYVMATPPLADGGLLFEFEEVDGQRSVIFGRGTVFEYRFLRQE
jgi:CubicO group peptidase (beta-lactamase class C family)